MVIEKPSISRPRVKKTFTDFLRVTFKGILDPIAGFLNRIGLTPNSVTLLGVAGNIIAAYFIIRGQITIGGIVMLVAWPIDALDGSMARCIAFSFCHD
jgi:hypothetical protein